MTNRKMTLRLLLTLLLALIISACSGLAGEPEIVATLQPQPTQAPIEVAEGADLGATIYQARCASCHGIGGMGDGAVAINAELEVPDFTDPQVAQSQTIAEWTNVIKNGRLEKLMPPWKDSLSAEEIDAVAEYTYTMWENPPDPEAVAAANEAESGAPDPHSDVASAASDSESDDPDALPADLRRGTVSGEIIMGTDGADLPATLSLGLHVLGHDNSQVEFHTLEVRGDDNYSINGVALSDEYSYMTSIIHDSVVFASEQMMDIPDGDALTLPITIYESTTDPNVVQIEMLTMMLVQDPGRTVVQQFMRFGNTSDRAYRGDTEDDDFGYDTVEIPLPQGATLLNRAALQERFRIESNADERTVLVDTRPVVPNETQMVEIIYGFPRGQAVNEVDVPVYYAMNAAPELLYQSDIHRVDSSAFQREGERQFDFGTFESFTASPLAAGESITFRVEALRDTAVAGVENTVTATQGATWLLLVLGTLLVVTGVGLLVRQRFTTSGRNALIEQIAALDAQYKAGDLDEATYQSQRRDLKQRLMDIIQQEEDDD